MRGKAGEAWREAEGLARERERERQNENERKREKQRKRYAECG